MVSLLAIAATTERVNGKRRAIVNYETLIIWSFLVNVGEVVLGWRNPGRIIEQSPKVMANRGDITQQEGRRMKIVIECFVKIRLGLVHRVKVSFSTSGRREA